MGRSALLNAALDLGTEQLAFGLVGLARSWIACKTAAADL